MGNTASDTKFQALFRARKTSEERPFRIVAERTAKGIANLIREGCNTWHLRNMRFHGQLLVRIGALSCTPSLTIYKYGRIDFINRLADGVHRFDVMDTHQVETETVDMIFVDPIFHRLQHKLAHHRLVGSCLVATAGAVGVSPIFCLPIIIVRIGFLEIRVVNVIGVIIHHVEDDTDACLMQRLYHLFEFHDSTSGIVWVGGIRTIRYVVVYRIISPVVFVVGKVLLINRAEIV